MEAVEKNIYCSLDLELTGFDPSVDEILEVGLVLFTMENGIPSILEQWSSVFKPTREVRPKILALTGIAKQEVESAPLFKDCIALLQQKLRGTILVGHSISVDIRFLEAFGVPVTNVYIDTLDLVQFLLPTHHSYNLEAIMHYFHVPHPEAHRALEDAKATVVVLQRLLGVYSLFPTSLQDNILAYASKDIFPWILLFSGIVSPATDAPNSPLTNAGVPHVSELTSVLPNLKQGIVTIPLGLHLENIVVAGIEGNRTLSVLGSSQHVLNFYKQGSATPIFSDDDLFNDTKFQSFCSRSNLGRPELLFILKILVWKATNWQQHTVVDINFSASGRQFRQFITGGVHSVIPDTRRMVTDYKTYLEKVPQHFKNERQIIIESVDKFEKFLSARLGVDISWNRVVSVLKNIYNPETRLGNLTHAAIVSSALSASDLFFGLVRLLFKDKHGSIDVSSLDPYVLNKVFRAAAHYVEKLQKVQNEVSSRELNTILENFSHFFTEDHSLVKWIEISDTKCVFYARPLALAPAMGAIIDDFTHVLFVSDVNHGVLKDYYTSRLELQNFEQMLVPASNIPVRKVFVQKDPLTPTQIVEASLASAPAVVLFSRLDELRTFYDNHFRELKASVSVFALGYSGGATKMLRNFAISKRSVLLATANFLYKQSSITLSAKHLIFIGDPDLDLTHPYTSAQAKAYAGGLDEFRKLKLYELLFAALRSCNTESLEHITFTGQDHASWVEEFISELPSVEVHSV